MGLLGEAQEPADAHDGIDDPAAHLLDDQPLNGADIPVVGAVDGGALDAVAFDKGSARARTISHHASPPLGARSTARAAEAFQRAERGRAAQPRGRLTGGIWYAKGFCAPASGPAPTVRTFV